MIMPGIASVPVPRIIPSAIPTTVEPWIIPSAVPTAIVPRIIVPRIIPSAVPCIVVVRTIVPGVVPGIVPSAIIPGIHAPVDRRVIRTVPGIPRRCIPRLISSPGVPTVIIEIDGSGVFVPVEIYLGYLVIRDEQGVDFFPAFHEDGRAFRLGHKEIGLFLGFGRDCNFSCRCVRSIVDSVLIPLSGGILSVLRC